MKLLLASFLLAVTGFAQGVSTAGGPGLTPVNDTYVDSGVVANMGSPFHPALFVGWGMLADSSTATVPVFVGMREESYTDVSGKPAFSGLATVKAVAWRKPFGKAGNKSFALFVDGSVGGTSTSAGISSLLQGGAGPILQFARHWDVFAEFNARRAPALDPTGTAKAFLGGIAYTFNKPK